MPTIVDDRTRLKEAVNKFWETTHPTRKARKMLQVQKILRGRESRHRRAAKEILLSLQTLIRTRLGSFRPKQDHSRAEVMAQIERVFDWKAWEKKAMERMVPVSTDSFRIAARTAFRKARVDPIGMKAKAWAKRNTGRLIADISSTARKNIANVVISGYDHGLDMKKIARRIMSTAGLTTSQAVSLDRRFKEWEAKYGEDKAVGMYNAKANVWTNARAELIATTELAAAASEGTLAAYKENDIKRVEWVTDDSPCPEICEPNSGKVFDIDEAQGLLPAHPNCECVWVMAIDG